MAKIDATNPNCVRAREGKAVASYYADSARITVVADDGSFADAWLALNALSYEITRVIR